MDDRSEQFLAGLNTKKVGDVTSDSIATLTEPVAISPENRELLQTTTIVNDATLRSDSGAIPNTGQVLSFTVSNQDRTVVFQPSKGEVYFIQSLAVTLTGRSGTVVHSLFWQDDSGLSTNGNLTKWLSESLTSSDAVVDDFDSSRPQFMDENLVLQYQATGTFTDSTLTMSVLRIR